MLSRPSLVLRCFCYGFCAASALGQTIYVPGGAVGSSSNGNVGVGTSAPTAKLESYTTAYQDAISAIGNDPINARVSVRNVNGNSYALISGIASISNAGFSLRDLTNSADRLVVTSNGNVGVGTSSPNYPFQVSKPAPASSSLCFPG